MGTAHSYLQLYFNFTEEKTLNLSNSISMLILRRKGGGKRVRKAKRSWAEGCVFNTAHGNITIIKNAKKAQTLPQH